MFWRKLAWRIYQNLGSSFKGTKFVRIPICGRTFGQRFDGLVRQVFSTRLPNPMIVDGHTIYWPQNLYSACPEIISEGYEQEVSLLWKNLLSPEMTVVDLGANIGLYSLLAARVVGSKGKVYAFEPEPSNYELLLKNIKINGYEGIIIPIKKAITDRPGEIKLFLGQRDSGETSMYPTPGAGQQMVLAEAITLDNFFESEGWPFINLIKMDIEGAEKAALEGMKQVVKSNQSLKLIMEFFPNAQVAAGVTTKELFEILIKLGFRKVWNINNGLKRIEIPDDVSTLVRTIGNGYSNLLFER